MPAPEPPTDQEMACFQRNLRTRNQFAQYVASGEHWVFLTIEPDALQRLSRLEADCCQHESATDFHAAVLRGVMPLTDGLAPVAIYAIAAAKRRVSPAALAEALALGAPPDAEIVILASNEEVGEFLASWFERYLRAPQEAFTAGATSLVDLGNFASSTV